MMSDLIDTRNISCDIVKRHGLDIEFSRCVYAHHRNASCRRCEQTCPVGAVTVAQSVRVDFDKCTGCGLCATQCPTGALEANSPTLAELCALTEERAHRAGAVTFRCSRYAKKGRHQDVIEVPCVGRVDEAVLLSAAAAGAETICLQDGGCEQCVQSAGRELAAGAAVDVTLLLDGLGSQRRLRVLRDSSPEAGSRDAAPTDSGMLSRRAFFTMLKNSGQKNESNRSPDADVAADAEQWLSDISSSIDNKKTYIPRRNEIIIDAIYRIVDNEQSINCSIDMLCDVSVDKYCNCCGICAASCPTGALVRVEQDGDVGLAFAFARCTGCGLCLDICGWNSLILSHGVRLSRTTGGSPKVIMRHHRENVAFLDAPMEDKLRKLLGTNLIS
ncbi:4Fe-4S binding protein [Telmatospirillum sp.]|uniref:4Fe-4S binding protein n=1 Tax=Telmatospirillum sp. TaxID=2079197 RepID=UPI002846318E|nr:4Fe-4S binding protein [Telmatospirillum sp.]MDR3437927.1 4Fe-4S binding protein [Telmatospirillum sp.]